LRGKSEEKETLRWQTHSLNILAPPRNINSFHPSFVRSLFEDINSLLPFSLSLSPVVSGILPEEVYES